MYGLSTNTRQKVRKRKMDNIEKLLLIVLFIAILYYPPLCGIVGFIEFVKKTESENKTE